MQYKWSDEDVLQVLQIKLKNVKSMSQEAIDTTMAKYSAGESS
jgi:hypothetical protein